MGIFILANSPSRLKGVGALPWQINSALSTIFFCSEVLGGLMGETSGYDGLFRMVRFFFMGASALLFSGIFLAVLFSWVFSVDGSEVFLVSTTFFVSVVFFGEFPYVFLLRRLYCRCTSKIAFSKACCSASSASLLTFVWLRRKSYCSSWVRKIASLSWMPMRLMWVSSNSSITSSPSSA